MAQRLRTLVAAVNGSNQALEPYRDIRRMGGGSQDSAHVSVGRAFALVGALAWVAEREASGDFDCLEDDPDERDWWTGHDQDSKQENQPESAGEFDYLSRDPDDYLWDYPDDIFWDPDIEHVEIMDR